MTNPMKPSISIGMMPPSYGTGVGISQNNFWKERTVASGKHGIYPGKGLWDYDLEEEDEDEDLQSLGDKINMKAYSSTFQIPNDSKPKPDHKSYSNLGSHNLVSHAEKPGFLLKEYIREILKESSISGRSYVKKTLGDPYYQDSNDIGSGINRAKSNPKLRTLQLPNVTSDGIKDMKNLTHEDNEFDEFDEDKSSFDLWFSFDRDKDNLDKHNKRKNC